MNQVVKSGPRAVGSAAKPLRQVANIRELLVNDQAKQQLASVAAQHMRPERMMRLMANAIRTTPQLAECEPLSLLGSLMTCASLGLEPNTPLGHAYLIPFKNKRKGITEIQLIIGYKGMIDLARRSGHIVNIHADVVYEGDDFSFEYGSNQHLTHRPKGKREKPIYSYCHAKLTDGEAFTVIPWDEVMAIRDASQGYQTAKRFGRKDNPWMQHVHAMAAKTAVRALFKYLPISVEMDNGVSDAFTVDDQSIDYAAYAQAPEEGYMIEGAAEAGEDDAPEPSDEPEAEPETKKAPPKREPNRRTKADKEPEGDGDGDVAGEDPGIAPGSKEYDRLDTLAKTIMADMAEADVSSTMAFYDDAIEEIKVKAPDLHQQIMDAAAELGDG